jgi:hypothetical protein
MSINKDNYETFLIDYLDGKLNANEVSEVLLFLELHPEIKAEFEGISGISIPQEELSLDFSDLKKPIFDEAKRSYEPLLIAQLEGELGIDENIELQKGFVLYPELKREEFLFSQTKFVTDHSVVFPQKQQLKKGSLFIVHRNTILRIAAILLLISAVGISVSHLTKNPETIQTAVIETPGNNKPKTNESASNIIRNKVEPRSAIQSKNQSELQLLQSSKENIVSSSQKIQKQQLATYAMDSKNIQELETIVKPEFAPLTKSNSWLAYTPPATISQTNEFIDLPTFLRNKLNKGTKQIETKTIAALEDMNKTAGISVVKDSITGKILHFEIVALGLEWSQSK